MINRRDLKAMGLEQIEVLSYHLPREAEKNHEKRHIKIHGDLEVGH